MIIPLVLGLLLGGATVVFALQNMTPISVVFFSWTIDGSLAFILILTMAAGVAFSMLLSLPSLIKKSFHISNLKKQNRGLQEDLESKKAEVEIEKSKLDANNAYLDDLEKTSNNDSI